MPVKFTHARCVSTREEIAAPSDPFGTLKSDAEECARQFHANPVTPQSTVDLENAIAALAKEACRQLLERELNRAESNDKAEVPNKIRYHKETYRLNKKTPLQVATLFGVITLWSFLYLNETDGEPGLHPLRLRLGIGAGSATPALLEHAARLSVDHTQAEVRAWLLREHGLKWSNTRLRKALTGYRDAILPFVPALQKARLLTWLAQAQASRGRYRPVLAAGRDGIMVPMRNGHYEEASTATVSVYDRGRRRLGTIYLGQMPETKQATLSKTLTSLLRATLKDWYGPEPRLAYLTDKGSACDEYYQQILKKMTHPRDGQPLEWKWVLDFWHVCSYIGKMADALFGADTKAGREWFAKMRRWLKERLDGAANVLRSAMAYLDRRKMTKAQKAEFWKAYRYIRRHRRLMDYVGYRRRGLPIGSGVTEAACKTVFTQRFKRSGMRWNHESGQVILDLRVVYLSGLWAEAFAADLAARELPQPAKAARRAAQQGSHQANRRFSPRLAA